MVSDTITGPNPVMATVPVESTGAYTTPPPAARRAVEKLHTQFPHLDLPEHDFRDEVTITVPREHLVAVATFLRDDEELAFRYLSDLTGNDWPDRQPRFEVNYQLYSLETYTRLRLKVRIPADDCHCPTVTGVWSTANWHERETFDLFGILFDGHPDLRRILLPDEWVGHPLRQDYALGWEQTEFTVRTVERPYAKS